MAAFAVKCNYAGGPQNDEILNTCLFSLLEVDNGE